MDGDMDTFLGIGEIEWVMLGLIGLSTVFWIWMLIDIAIHEKSDKAKVIWLILVVITHILGALLYFLIRRPIRMREQHSDENVKL